MSKSHGKRQSSSLRAHQTSVPLQELAKRYPKELKATSKYIYDFTGTKERHVWDKLLSEHHDCRALIEGDTLRFACFTCINMHCYWRTQKDRLIKEGYKYE